MPNLTVVQKDGQHVIDSREVAEMVEKNHAHLLRDIKGYSETLDKSENPKLDSLNFFIPSTYSSEGNTKTYPCYLLTRKGCDMVANKMTGEKGVLFTAAYVTKFEEMERQIKAPALNTSELSPQLQLFNQMFQALATQELEVKAIKSEIQGIRDVITLDTTNWRPDSSKIITKIAQKLGGNDHIRDVRREAYELLDKRFGVDVQARLTNKRRRMADEGICKSKRDKLNQLDVIADDKKLIEGFTAIVKEMAIKYGIEK